VIIDSGENKKDGRRLMRRQGVEIPHGQRKPQKRKTRKGATPPDLIASKKGETVARGWSEHKGLPR